jgi:hypothetical protein
LSLAAVVTAILPAPVIFFQLLPAYDIQTKFLIFYGPLVCFLTLAYLFYVRDSLARAMFADLLDPAPAPDPYYGEPSSASFRRIIRRVRSLVLALLPVALLLLSSYFAVEYIRLLSRSVHGAVEQRLADPSSGGELAGAGGSTRDMTQLKVRDGRGRRKAAARSMPVDTAARTPNSDSIRQHVLDTAKVDDIPSFLRLCGLYIGIFLSAEIAFILMALKEYAKDAMGLSERDIMLGAGPEAHR